MKAESGAGRLRSVVFALAIKEFRESSAALIAGSFIFVGLPVLWTLLYCWRDPFNEIVAGFSVYTFTLCAWLFAPVLAAQAVCRDWGRPVGDFLLSRPVSARLAMLVKGVVTFAIIVGIVAAVVLMEALLRSFADTATLSAPLSDAAIAAVCVAFWIAFGAAAITRDTFRSVLLAVLLLVLITLAPLLSARFSWLSGEAGIRTATDGRMWALAPLAWAMVIGISALGLLAALFGAGSPRAMKITTRSIAWAVALAMVGLFPLAMGEIGNDVSQVTTHWTDSAPASRPGAIAIGKRRTLVTEDGGWLLMFELTGQGYWRRRPAFWGQVGWNPASGSGAVSDRFPVIDEQDRLFALWTTLPLVTHEGRTRLDRDKPMRTSLQRAALRNEAHGPIIDLSIPEGIPPLALKGVHGVAIRGGHLYVLYSHALTRKKWQTSAVRTVVLADYKLAEDAAPIFERSVVFVGMWQTAKEQFPYRFSRGADDRLYVVADGPSYGGLLTRPFDVSSVWDDSTEFGHYPGPRSVSPYSEFVIGKGVAAASSRSGLNIFETNPRAVSKPGVGLPATTLLGNAKASPWAQLFRSENPMLLYAGPGRLWEVHRDRGRAICYDVSDPRRPRRIAHVSTYRIYGAVSGPDFLVLNHGVGFSIVRHPK